ncbi:hypothetical protein ARC78_09845 [Stenotrophomonas pictorum JCM 9942]|uniref:Lipocalin-like domain-containing protein n=1 Tax=Stenotrophomonas pictorum JCM 9942 TaxID=1236960 RepID=A0A0R0AB72_9GAMM|nr:hypothetical protein [Stenotrophomonas pictorum]KRG42235.1 hypothetical protein ARC78_09845 [Stenotrophomonas pictorum JCM 9942]
MLSPRSVAVAVAVAVLLGGLACLATAAASDAPALQGAWQLQSGESVNKEGAVVDYASQKLAGTKLLADGRFAFTTTSDGKFWAGGSGTYTTEGGRYVETPLMASYPLESGGLYEFRYTLEGDVWTLERWDGERRVEREVWRRVAR